MASTANTLWSFEPVPFYAQKKENCSVHAWRTQAAQTTFLNSSVVRKLTHGIGQQPESNPGWKKITMTLNSGDQKTKKKQNTNDSWYMGEKRKQRGTMLSMASQFLSFSPLLFTCWTWPQTPKNVNYPAKKTHMLHQVARIIDPTLHGLIQSQFLHTTRRQCLCPLKVPSSKLISW